MAPERTPNRLARATSPYLKQHQYNPVGWYPWGPEALERARRKDKPIFLSIGYSTCHWCHVMAHESFEDEGIAAILNEHFISIKVDREERPDLDETYMNVVTALTGRGGWPLSVFLTPDLKPFYGGTYFPPTDRGGLPGFPRLLLALSQAYRQNQEQIAELSRRVLDHLQKVGAVGGEGPEPDQQTVFQAAQFLLQDFDAVNGGLGGAPKFPRSLELGFLLHYYRFSGEFPVLEKLAFSLEKMARGGIYDQLGGGFHRYTVDGAWVVPHFEKMLYDNALLAPLYLAHYQLKGSPLSRRIAIEILDFVLREMQAPDGGFYSGWDADSEGVEGKYYVWSLEEVERVVGPGRAALTAAALGVTREGNFEGENILTRPLTQEELAPRFSLTPEQLDEELNRAREALRQVRERRVKPHRDEKIIVSWNGLMLSALALGAQVLGERRYYEAAAKGARFILENLLQGEVLHRSCTAGQVSGPGFSEDYASLAQALLDLYETDFDPAWLIAARRLMALLEKNFLDPEDGLYFYVAKAQESPLVRSKSIFDQTLPSGNSLAARVCLKLHRLTEEAPYRERALTILRAFLGRARENPFGFAYLWTVAVLYLSPPLDLTLVGEVQDPRLQEMLTVAYRQFLPERRLLVKDPVDCALIEELSPAARTYGPLGEGPTAYLCHDFTCRPAIKAATELEAKLGQFRR
ncbi:MAG: thioredoxin domain-containing protein [Deltaproteobacteria bacterium]|nr:thioredoxin domain-containing protein [Deltaproteobacteria bacterium]MBI4795980.1 thioredoxin domain-containing protein [Deltaproteobacteria bacterium]